MISLNWIKDYIDLDGIDLKELATKITNAGVNVQGVITHHIDKLVIGKIVACVPHPDSDHLHVCQVDIGKKTLQIVCGAKNARVNVKAIVALEGAILPGNFEIKKSTIRGVESNGMMCALFELGLEEKNDASYEAGIFELDDKAPIGEDPLKYLGLDDTVYDLDLNPNRNIDCTNHIGFAYEIGSVIGKKVKLPQTEYQEISNSIKEHLKIQVDTPNCLMYNAKMVTNLTIKESPKFIQNRLISAGMRPINNVVDISNYVMLEYGQPTHFFDADKLGNKIVVRMANNNEEIVTLDHKKRILKTDDIVITNGTDPVCIAGVMGGLDTEVDQNTKTIVIESAIFKPYNIRYTSLNLDLRSEASLRYERGLNKDYTIEALNRCCYLLTKYADAQILSDMITIDNIKDQKKEVEVTTGEINKILGLSMAEEDIEKSLTNLGFPYLKNNGKYLITIPNRRLDVEPNKADIAEEVGRLYGFDKIVATLPKTTTKQGKYIGSVALRKTISKRLRSLGLNEVKTYTLISEEENNCFKNNRHQSIEVLRPMSSDRKVIRQTIIPSLLKVFEYNKFRNVRDVNIYEIANTYYDENVEDTKISILMTGDYIENNWSHQNIKVDFYLLKGIVENLLNYLGFKNRFSFVKKEIDDLHPGISASILLDQEEIGFIGKVHPQLNKNDLYVSELSLTKLVGKNIKPLKFKEISKYPTISKDVAFIVDKKVMCEDIIKVITHTGGRLLTNIEVFDLYTGENVLENQKSLAFSLTFSDDKKTLSDEEVMTIFNKIITDVEDKLKAQVRDK